MNIKNVVKYLIGGSVILGIIVAVSLFFEVDFVKAEATSDFSERLKGRILLQVEENGEAWYVDPVSCYRYYLEDGPAAYYAMWSLGLGISNADLELIPKKTLITYHHTDEFDFSLQIPDSWGGSLGIESENIYVVMLSQDKTENNIDDKHTSFMFSWTELEEPAPPLSEIIDELLASSDKIENFVLENSEFIEVGGYPAHLLQVSGTEDGESMKAYAVIVRINEFLQYEMIYSGDTEYYDKHLPQAINVIESFRYNPV